jgi:DNA-binding MarR family transcriptional regulator
LAHLHALFQLARNGPPHWARHDLTFGQLRLLFVLAHAGPVSIGKLADMLSVTDATASEIVDRLERRSLAIRSHRSDDRRVVECRLSDAGARLVAEVAGARAEMMRASLSVLTATELAQLDGLLRVMAERLPAVIAPSASAEGDAQVMSETPLATAPEDSRGKA